MEPSAERIAQRWLHARTPREEDSDSVSLSEYKLMLQGRGSEALAERFRNAVRMSSDWCKIIPPACEGNLGIPRTAMPQILREDLPEFLNGLREQGISVRKTQHRVGELKATQREISTAKVMKKLGQPPKIGGTPSVVSKDGYVLDGHHRWATELTRNPRSKIPVWLIGLPIKKLLSEAQNFDRVYHAQSIDDFSIPEQRAASIRRIASRWLHDR